MAAFAAAAVAGGCGERGERDPFVNSVQEVIERPPLERPVAVRGRAVALGTTGFVLYDEEASIWVLAPARRVREVRAGEPVTVKGVPDRLTQDQAVRLANAVARGRLAAKPGFDRVLAARRDRGDAYIDAGVATGRRSSQE